MPVEAGLCPTCGTPLPPEAHFCLNCGTPTPTEPGVPERTVPTGTFEVSRIRKALADRYKIERVLGEGGMATVYLAEDLKHRRKVAVKVMRPELAETLGADRFLREVEIAAKLSHPHILPVYDSGAADGILYYVMPVVEGESLPAKLKREKQLPVEEALRLAREVAEALAYAHRHGFVHRDIKPANILLSDGHALVADFGIARATGDEAQALTKTGLAIGTPHYMSPEQASGDPNIDGRTDIYALGAVLYEMLAGEPPFTGPTAQSIITRSITEQPRALTATRQSLVPAVNSTVMRALAKSPADRYADAGAMVSALVAAEDQTRTGSGAIIAPQVPHRFKVWQYAVAAIVVLALGALSWKAFANGGGGAAVARSVAVLPFQNQGADSDAYFADGIVDEVRGKLAKVGNLTVIASASANQYRGTTKTGPEIAKELHVDQVLMGKVRWAAAPNGGRKVQVVAELVNGKTGATTWQQSFDADVTDVFGIQSQIATKVAASLGSVLQPRVTAELEARPTSNSEAYDLYLKGNAITSNSAASMRVAAGYYEQAVALDSTFGRAWAQLGRSLSLVYSNGTREPAVGRRAREAIDRALALAPNQSYSHAAAALYHRAVDRDVAAQDSEAQRALELDPDNAVLLANSAGEDFRAERYAEVFRKLSRARELDPRSVPVLTTLIRTLVYLGRLDEAKAAGEELMALNPTDPSAIEWGAGVHLLTGDLAGAQAVVKDAIQRMPATEVVSYFAGYNEMAFVLEPKERELLFRLTPAAFDNDVAWWGQALGIAAHQFGDSTRARAYADSALATSKEQSDANPSDPQLRALYAVMLAYVGRTGEAIREVNQAVKDAKPGDNNNSQYARMQRVRVYLEAGDQDKAIDGIEELMHRQYYLTRGYLKVDPTFDPLRNNPRFKKLVAAGVTRPVD